MPITRNSRCSARPTGITSSWMYRPVWYWLRRATVPAPGVRPAELRSFSTMRLNPIRIRITRNGNWLPAETGPSIWWTTPAIIWMSPEGRVTIIRSWMSTREMEPMHRYSVSRLPPQPHPCVPTAMRPPRTEKRTGWKEPTGRIRPFPIRIFWQRQFTAKAETRDWPAKWWSAIPCWTGRIFRWSAIRFISTDSMKSAATACWRPSWQPFTAAIHRIIRSLMNAARLLRNAWTGMPSSSRKADWSTVQMVHAKKWPQALRLQDLTSPSMTASWPPPLLQGITLRIPVITSFITRDITIMWKVRSGDEFRSCRHYHYRRDHSCRDRTYHDRVEPQEEGTFPPPDAHRLGQAFWYGIYGWRIQQHFPLRAAEGTGIFRWRYHLEWSRHGQRLSAGEPLHVLLRRRCPLGNDAQSVFFLRIPRWAGSACWDFFRKWRCPLQMPDDSFRHRPHAHDVGLWLHPSAAQC